jgi:hypothetical protein
MNDGLFGLNIDQLGVKTSTYFVAALADHFC